MAILVFGTPCALTGRAMEETDYIVCFPHFILDSTDPLFPYSDSCMLRDAFDRWEHRKVFLARLQEFWREVLTMSGSWHLFLDTDGYWIEWGGYHHVIRLLFLNHMLAIDIDRPHWEAVRNAFLEAAEGSVSTCQFGNQTLSIQESEEQVEIAHLIRLAASGATWRDRIRISQREWGRLLEILKEVDENLLPQMDKVFDALH